MNLRYSPSFELKLAGDMLVSGEFTGYASTFNGAPDSYGDIVAPGAFTKSLTEFAARSGAPAMLWCHEANEPCGVWARLAQDAHGLNVSGKFTLDTQRGREARALAKDGALGLSIGFTRPIRERVGNGQILKSMDLLEISVVPMALAANQSAVITQVKTGPERPASIRDLESALQHQLGFTIREAKTMASAGWRALNGLPDPSAEIAAALKLAAQSFLKK